jgi:Uma2 family endonuclease
MNIADVAPERIRPLLRSEYDRLVESGAFESERVELLEGMLVTMTPQDAAHAHTVQRLAEALTLALTGKAIVRTQSPLALLDDSEPEPDIAVVPLGDYSAGHPTAAYLVVEISGSSLRRDRLVKAPIYARAGVEEYWLIDLNVRVVEVHRHSDGGRFTSIVRVGEDGSLRVLRYPDVDISMRDILPTVRGK